MKDFCVGKTLLCVEDDKKILQNNSIILTDSGYDVITAETLAQARRCLLEYTPDAIILDIMLPDGTGLELLSELREQGNKILVLLLTARDKSSDIEHGLLLGANDYLSKPFEYNVLLARIETMFRNAEQSMEIITRGLVKLNTSSMIATVNEVDVRLSPNEYRLLQFFIRNENRFIKAKDIYEKVWGQPMGDDKNAVKVAVSRLRRKLKEGNILILFDEEKDGYYFTIQQ